MMLMVGERLSPGCLSASLVRDYPRALAIASVCTVLPPRGIEILSNDGGRATIAEATIHLLVPVAQLFLCSKKYNDIDSNPVEHLQYRTALQLGIYGKGA